MRSEKTEGKTLKDNLLAMEEVGATGLARLNARGGGRVKKSNHYTEGLQYFHNSQSSLAFSLPCYTNTTTWGYSYA